MLDFPLIKRDELLRIGTILPRQRGQHGELKRIGKDKWRARWYRRDGNDQRKPVVKTFSGFASKVEAQKHLDQLINESTNKPLAASANPKVSEVWHRYFIMKTPDWEKHNRETIDGIMRRAVLSQIGEYKISQITRDTLQTVLNVMVERKLSRSSIAKARTYIKAMMEYATDEDLISKNPATGKKITVPKKAVAPCGRYLEIAEIEAILAKAPTREHLILRLFIVGGFRPAELFVLRPSDVGLRRLRIDEALKQAEKNVIGATKTADSNGYVAISADLQQELDNWVSMCSGAFLFPSEVGTPFWPGNYLKRVLKPLAMTAGIKDMTFQCLRRTCATWFRADVKSAQAQLRHSNPQITAGRYMKSIDSEHAAAVEELDALFMGRNSKNDSVQ